MFNFFIQTDSSPQDSAPTLDLEAVMDEYGTEMLRLCTLYLKDYQLAQDAVQETFLRVYTGYASFHGKSSLKTWVTTIAMNVCRDMMRRHSYKERPLYLPEDEEEQEAYMENIISVPESSAPDIETKLTLIDAVTGLPEIYRKTILLYYYNGFTTAEIAKILHCPQSTVNVRLKRGRDMLRRTLGD